MAISRKARIRWLRPEEGGRTRTPTGPFGSTAPHFEILSEQWPHEAWGVTLKNATPVSSAGVTVTEIQMIAGDEAPKRVLAPGSRFSLYEGKKCVGEGEVL